MTTSSSSQFGLLVAYLLPGFIGLAGLAPLLPALATWLQPSSYTEASLGPPVYAILAATTVGMITSCVRWLVVDRMHRWAGLTPPVWDDRRLERQLAAFSFLVENQYRYYQFAANSLIAIVWAYAINRWIGTSPLFGVATDVGVAILCAVLFAASRDALAKYYTRTSRLFGQSAQIISER